MSERIHPGDFFVAMIHYLPEGRKCFKCDYEKLNTFLHQEKQKYPEALSSFGFNLNGSWPRSRELSQVITNLFDSRLIVVSTSMPYDYHFHPKCEESYQKFAKERIPEERLPDIEAIALALIKN